MLSLGYAELVKHRNKVVHGGELVTQAQAESYLETARKLIAYMDDAMRLEDDVANRDTKRLTE